MAALLLKQIFMVVLLDTMFRHVLGIFVRCWIWCSNILTRFSVPGFMSMPELTKTCPQSVKFGDWFFTNQTALLVARIRCPNAGIWRPSWNLLEIRTHHFSVLSAPIILINDPKNYMKTSTKLVMTECHHNPKLASFLVLKEQT